MGTVSKEIALDIIKGKYAEDQPISITQYDNAWGGKGYGVVFNGEIPTRYAASEYVKNPKQIWHVSEGYTPTPKAIHE